MPKAAIFFSIILFSSLLTNSYALTSGDLVLENNESKIIFDTEILNVNSNFFTENDFKRYLIFGGSTHDTDFLKNNSLYGIQSNSGFFYVSVLSEQSASNLISQGFYVIEDSKLDFHLSDNIISDSSRIGEITSASIAKKKI